MGNEIKILNTAIQNASPQRTFGAAYGKHKVPRYIYHFTNRQNYNKMLEDGFIRSSQDATMDKRGVFAIELTNFLKHWVQSKSWGFIPLQERLLMQVAKGEEEIVAIKIPTKNLNQDKLFIRSQNRLFNPIYNAKGKHGWKKELPEKIEQDGTWNTYKKYSTDFKHIESGTPAKYSTLFEQRKEAIEYIYEGDIPINQTQKIGTVNIGQIRGSESYNFLQPLKSIFRELFKGTPEIKSVEHADLLNYEDKH